MEAGRRAAGDGDPPRRLIAARPVPGPVVVHLMGWRSQQYGSFERFLARLADGVAGSGGRMHLVFREPPASRAFVDDVDADVHVIPAAAGPADRRYVGRVRGLLRALEPTHLHAHFGLDAYLALATARAMGVPHRLFTKHIRPGSWRTLAPVHHRWLAAQVEAMLAVSEEVAEDLAGVGVPRSKLHVVRLGVDPGAYRVDPAAGAAVRAQLGIEEGRKVVLSTSHLRPGKGVELLPPLAAALADDPGGTVLLAAGDGELRDALAADARDRDLGDDAFRLLGVREDVPALLAAADAFVFTTDTSEGLGLGPLEALASGVPVVASAVSDLPRLLGGGARMVTPGDAGALVAATREALAEGRTPERDALVREALARVDPANAVRDHLRLYGLATSS